MKHEKRPFLLYLLLFCCSLPALATADLDKQTALAALDSIRAKYTAKTEIPIKEFHGLVDLLYEFSDQMQFEACDALVNFLFPLAANDLSKEGTLYHILGYNQARQRKNSQAVEYYLASATRRRKTGEDVVLNYTLSNLGKVYYDLGDYVKAINAYKEALEAANRSNDKACKALALNGIAIVLSDQKKYGEALLYLYEATENYRLAKDSVSMGRNYFDLGEVKYLMKEQDSALYYFKQAIKIGQRTQDELVISYSLHRMGSIYLNEKNYQKAEPLFLEALAIRKKIDYPLEVALSHLDLAQLYEHTQQYDQALSHSHSVRNLAKQTDFLKGQSLAAQQLANLYEKQGKYKEALEFHQEFKRFNDSLFSVEKNQKIEDFNTEIQIEKRTNTLKLNHAKQKNNLLLLSFSLGMITLVITVYFLRLKARNKRKYDYQIKQQETEAEKQTILGIYAERKRISRDVHDDLGSCISGIKMLSELIFDQTTDPALKENHAKLLEMQAEATEKVRDIIWMLNCENNTLDKLVWYCRSYAEKMMERFAVHLQTTTQHSLPLVELTDDERKNFFLCVKEALNNVLKHAKASQVELLFCYEDDKFTLILQDNGKGFDKQPHKGFKNGIENMKNRMSSIEGYFEITSSSKGTRVLLSKYIPRTGH